jgi:N-acetyl-anhydromuramoyl-L-alanine amidase
MKPYKDKEPLVIENHIIGGIPFMPSPNSDWRPEGTSPDLIVVHGISLPPGVLGGEEIIDLFMNRLDWDAHTYFQTIKGLRVSAHVLIRRDGTVMQFVPFDQRAWHAGESSWNGREDCNDFAIGIELEGADDILYRDEQYESLVGVCRALREAYGIQDIARHSDIAPGRKTDPGDAFDWYRLKKMLA